MEKWIRKTGIVLLSFTFHFNYTILSTLSPFPYGLFAFLDFYFFNTIGWYSKNMSYLFLIKCILCIFNSIPINCLIPTLHYMTV